MPESQAITVAVGRFPDLLARGLRNLIDEDPRLELLLGDIAPAQLSSLLRRHRPRVAIVDEGSLHSPVEVRELTAKHPSTHLLLLADVASRVEAPQLLAFGAAACLAKAPRSATCSMPSTWPRAGCS